MSEYMKNAFPNILSLNSVVAFYHTNLAGINHPGESHNFWELAYVDRGIFNVNVDGIPYTINEGQIIMYAPLSYHSSIQPNDATLNIVSFETSSDIISYYANKVITLSGKQRQMLSQIMSVGERCFKTISPDSGFKGMIQRKDASAFDLQKIKSLLELLLVDICEKNESTSSKPNGFNYENYASDTFNILTQYLKYNISKTLTLDEICNDCTISLSRLKKVCREQCGMSPMSYFISLKIDASKTMINDTSFNFTQISEILGFSSVHYFSKLFKKKVGVSPTEYAKAVYKQ